MTTSAFASKVRVTLLLLGALAALGPPHAWSQSIPDDKLDLVLQARSRQLAGRSRVIVQFSGRPDPRLISGSGGIAGRQLPSVGAQVADLNNTTLAGLAGNPQVAWMRADHPVFATLERTGAAVARDTYNLTGKGIGVAVIDSGITAWHDDLYLEGSKSPRSAPRVVHFKDFTVEANPRVWTSDQPSDEYGHGTHVAGVIAGNGFDSGGARTGVAPEANLIGLKVLDADGQGYISDVIAALDYAIAIRDAYNIRVINLSVASGVFESYHTDPLAQAARRAADAGIVVIAAAGNLGTNARGEPQYGGVTCPGNAPWVLTVGAASHEGTRPRGNDTLARFSSRGPTWIDFAAKPDLVAPGVGTESLSDPHSTLYSTYVDYLLDGTRDTPYKPYLSLTGTSMAAPVVAGTVALMLEANPDLTPNAVKAILQYTAEVREGESFLAQGAGLLNTLGAIRMARFFATPKRGTPEPGDVIEREYVAWSEHLIWGNDRISGGIPLPGSNAWALGVTWGADATSSGEPIVWGAKGHDNIVWSTKDHDNIVWSTANRDNIVWSTANRDNIVWSTDCGGEDCTGVIWGARGEGDFIWGTAEENDNIVWSTRGDDNIIWSTRGDDNIVWSTGRDNIVWSTEHVDQILWPASQPVDHRRRATTRAN